METEYLSYIPERSIAIFGGSFDPPHLGHLEIAKKALEVVDEVIFVPCYKSNYTNKKLVASFEQRLDMIFEMLHGQYRMSVCQIEKANYDHTLDRGSYTIDTLNEFKSEYKSVSLLIGLDSLEKIETWHDYSRILEQYRLIVYPRRCSSFKCLDQLNNNISNVELIILNVNKFNENSSTFIRNNMKYVKKMNGVVHKDVLKYIVKHELYKMKGN